MRIPDDEILIWKYLDQDCSPDEEVYFRKKLEANTSFQKQYETIVSLHNRLKKQQHEVPPYRFSKNVMEALPIKSPAKVNRLQPVQILSRGYLTVIFSIVFLVVIYLFIVDYQPSGSTASIYTEFAEATRQPLWLQISWILISCSALLLVDKFLFRRKYHQSTSPV